MGILCGWYLAVQRENGNRIGMVAESVATEKVIEELRATLASKECDLSIERRACGDARAEVAGLSARITAEQVATADKLQMILDLEMKLKETFDSLAMNALDANAKRLLAFNRAEMETQKSESNKELAAKESAIALLLKPMQESLQRLALHSQDIEVKREGAYKAVLAEIENIQRTHTDLRKETAQLVQTLRAPKSRGNWGEMQLKRCVEYSGMVQHASFEVEKFVRGDDDSARPDLIVKLPNGRSIIVDAKTPLDAFLSANATEDELLRKVHLASHAATVRKHLDLLASKAYWNRFAESPDFVVCFLPSEVLFSAALEEDPSLLEHSARANVLLATPTTLIALLKAVAYGWQQSQIARDAELIRDAAISVQSKLAGMHSNFLDLGSHLRKAGDCYDDALTKAEGRGGLFSIAKRLRELKIGEKDLVDSKPTAIRPRMMESEGWQRGLSLAAEGDADIEADAEQAPQ
ncbi:MAG: DNA recombination protein RmuC [Acidobacteriaceae bacterium]